MRLPNFGMTSTMFGSEQILPTFGPMSTSLEGCKIFMKTVIDGKPWLREPSLLPFPWKEDDAFKGRKPKIAVLWDDGVVKPHPPVTCALKKVVEKLKAKGKVDIVEWTPYKHEEAWAIIVLLLSIQRWLELIFAGKPILLRWGRRRLRRHERGW